MLFRALHADTTKEMFFSQIVAVEELIAWLEACPRKGDLGYVPADYVDPPELEEVTKEAPRVDAARISRVSKPVGEGSFGSTVVSVAHWKQSWKKKKQKVALKRAIDPKEKVSSRLLCKIWTRSLLWSRGTTSRSRSATP